MLEIVFLLSLVSLAFAGILTLKILRAPKGTRQMQTIAGYIREGAASFLRRQYGTISVIALALSLIILFVYMWIGKTSTGFVIMMAFLFGALSSGLSGGVGMWMSVNTNIRVASAVRSSMSRAFRIALYGGAVSGFVIVSLSLMGVATLYYVLGLWLEPTEIPFLIVGYGFGASFVALFAQLGGGIYTKAADIGADLVGKVEAGIPEDDPRNPAVIADLVGDNVGDCAGRGADLFESTAAENIGAMIIGVALFPYFGINGILFPLVARAFGLIASMVGILFARVKEGDNPMKGLNRGFYVTTFISAIFFYFVTQYMLGSIWFFYAGLVGILASIALLLVTVYYTESSYRPVKYIARSSGAGHAPNIISGFAMALECTALPVIILAVALIASFNLGAMTGLPNGGIYGTAVATMGMLASCAYILAMDTFGPIVDNAGGIVEMSGLEGKTRERADRLDAAGNTTKALTKGYAIGSAGLAAFLLFFAYMDEMAKYGVIIESVDIAKVNVFAGAMIGAMLIYLFSSFAIRSVNDTAYKVIEEVRRQFREIPGIMTGKGKPDYARCVDITAKSALREMIVPGLVVVAVTIAVGMLLHAEAVAAYLMVATITGILLAQLMNTGGGAWDNAKKHIESGFHGGKGSDHHKAAVTGDMVGDPFKDTAGPSIHVLIKLLGTITLVLAPLFV